MKKMISLIVSIIALTVMAPGHAEELTTNQSTMVAQMSYAVGGGSAPSTYQGSASSYEEPWINFKVSNRDVTCLAKNIYYEAGNEPEEGKVAVGIVTVNRVKDARFGGTSICQVVNARTVYTDVYEKKRTIMVKTGFFGRMEPRVQTYTVKHNRAICQFSWTCQMMTPIKAATDRWQESLRVAQEILDNGYEQYREKYSSAMYFHALHVRPQWAHQKQKVGRIGGHIFYAEKERL